MKSVLEQIGTLGIIPVVVIHDAGLAVPLGRALMDGGLPCAEITFRTDAAADTIRAMTRACPEMLVGAGTVLTVDQAAIAIDSGARFIVSPGVNRQVIEFCVRQNVPVTPGAVTPTEIGTALDLGASVVKFFPAEAAGGLPYLKAISAPFRDIAFIPTGGINITNLSTYLKHPSVLACGGSWMVQENLICAGRFDEVTARTRLAMQSMLAFDLRSIGLKSPEPQRASTVVGELKALLELSGNGGADAPGTVEMAGPGLLGPDLEGQVLIATPFVPRAIEFARRKGAVDRTSTSGEPNLFVNLKAGRFAIRFLST